MNLIVGIIGSLIASAIAGICLWAYRRYVGQQIHITQPVDHECLAPSENRRGVQAHPVCGTLKRLPKGHRIWLIVADETRGRFWPQGFENIEYNAVTGTWKGYVTVFGWHRVTIFAVVAPPTSQDFFNYFQRVGQKTNHEPLIGIPSECKKRAVVQAKVPTV